MANSTQYAKTVAASPSKISTTELHGRVRVAYADFTADAAQETINMFKLPDGARIIGGRVNHAALGSSTTLSIGHAAYTQADGTAVAADVDEYKAAAASTSLTSFNPLSIISNAIFFDLLSSSIKSKLNLPNKNFSI